MPLDICRLFTVQLCASEIIGYVLLVDVGSPTFERKPGSVQERENNKMIGSGKKTTIDVHSIQG